MCVSLGLRVVGENIHLGNNNTDCQTRTIFHSTNVSVDMIYDELIKRANDSNQCSVDEFCRLYIHFVRFVRIPLAKVKMSSRPVGLKFPWSLWCFSSACQNSWNVLIQYYVMTSLKD